MMNDIHHQQRHCKVPFYFRNPHTTSSSRSSYCCNSIVKPLLLFVLLLSLKFATRPNISCSASFVSNNAGIKPRDDTIRRQHYKNHDNWNQLVFPTNKQCYNYDEQSIRLSMISNTDSGSNTIFTINNNPVATNVSYDTGSDMLQKMILPVIGFGVYCVVMALLAISFEDILCTNALPSRHRTELLSIRSSADRNNYYNNNNNNNEQIPTVIPKLQWGQATIGGMGFGTNERNLISSVDMNESDDSGRTNNNNLQSYNEIMFQHRTKTIPQWKQAKIKVDTQLFVTTEVVSNAIHVIIDNFYAIQTMQELATDYQWESIRSILRSSPVTDLSQSSAVLRNYIQYYNRQYHPNNKNDEMKIIDNTVIGFDWGSCGWRKHQCGAIADIQESYDEMDALLGVLEPFEILFCLDIAERSIRDILAIIIPWNLSTNTNDIEFLKNIPPYIPKVTIHINDDINMNSNESDNDELSRIDQEYLNTLQLLRVD